MRFSAVLESSSRSLIARHCAPIVSTRGDEFKPISTRSAIHVSPKRKRRANAEQTLLPSLALRATMAVQEDSAVRITVNGEQRDVADGSTVRSLLESLNIRTKAVAVERNREIVPKAEHAACVLNDGDRLEIVTLVGGG